MKIVHYRNKCIGCNACVEIASSFWRISKKDGKADLINSIRKNNDIFVLEINELDLEANLIAERDCPMNIIKIEK